MIVAEGDWGLDFLDLDLDLDLGFWLLAFDLVPGLGVVRVWGGMEVGKGDGEGDLSLSI
jgi:hypothetical protein